MRGVKPIRGRDLKLRFAHDKTKKDLELGPAALYIMDSQFGVAYHSLWSVGIVLRFQASPVIISHVAL